MRVAVGGIVHETNTYATALWGASSLDDFTRHAGEELLAAHTGGVRSCLGGMMAAAEEMGIEVVPTYHAEAQPSGTVSDSAFRTMQAELLDALRNALANSTIDAVALDLHGAGVYGEKSHSDLECEVGRSVRELIGPDMPLVTTLDLHGNLSTEMSSYFDVMLGFHLFPHEDQYERGDEVMRLIPELVSGRVKPISRVTTLPMLMPTNSTDEGWPMHDANVVAAALEEIKGVIDCTIFHGYVSVSPQVQFYLSQNGVHPQLISFRCYLQQFCDIEHVGVHVLTTTDNDAGLAERVGREMASWIWEHRDRFLLELTGAEQAVSDALAVPQSERQGRPVVLHETSDNCGGGATGDATYLIAAMLKRGAPFERGEACFGFIVDPEVVALATDAGVGSVLPQVSLGGKLPALKASTYNLYRIMTASSLQNRSRQSSNLARLRLAGTSRQNGRLGHAWCTSRTQKCRSTRAERRKVYIDCVQARLERGPWANGTLVRRRA